MLFFLSFSSGRLLQHNTFYTLLQFGRGESAVADPQQRITDDVAELCKTLCEMWCATLFGVLVWFVVCRFQLLLDLSSSPPPLLLLPSVLSGDERPPRGAAMAGRPELLKPLATIVFLTAKLYPLVGSRAVACLLAYMAAGIALIKVALPNFKQLVAEESRLEGTFKFVHARVRTHAESIAFFGGGAREQELVEKRFEQLEGVVATRLQTD